MPGNEVLDPATVAELRRAQEYLGNPAFIRQLVELFRTGAPAKVGRLREALAAHDGASIEHVAHTLKTNCAVLGATAMADACARLEAAAGRADFVDATLALVAIEQQFPRVVEALAKLAPATTPAAR